MLVYLKAALHLSPSEASSVSERVKCTNNFFIYENDALRTHAYFLCINYVLVLRARYCKIEPRLVRQMRWNVHKVHQIKSFGLQTKIGLSLYGIDNRIFDRNYAYIHKFNAA